VGDGKQAIERVQTDRPDIVLADVGMPERDGYEVAAFIKGDPALAHIPVLLLTGAFEPIDEARARAVGCDGVLVKPFEPQMVISRVRDLLAGKRDGGRGTVAATPAPAPAEPPGGLEAYFDRLDAALASKTAAGANVPPAPLVRGAHGEMDLSGWNPPAAASNQAASAQLRIAAPAAPAPAPSAADSAAVSPVNLDEAFSALLAAEQGLAVAPGPAAGVMRAPSATFPETLPDATLDAIAARVIARMGDDKMRAAVLDAAERLVREEIDRIKNAR
jgi:CheY-like chemotaxis protein